MPESELVVVAHFSAKPEKQAELLALLHSLLDPTRKEPGCLRYELNQEIENPCAFTFAEKFSTRKAFEAHTKMPYIVRFGPQAADLIESKQISLHRELLPASLTTGAQTPGQDDKQVIVIAHFTAKPGKQEGLSTFLQSLVEPTRREPGCIRYEVNQDLDDPSTFTFVETFAGQSAFDAHCQTPYVAKLFEVLPVLVEKQYIGLHRQILA